MAGAKNVFASLWKVDDAATRYLMGRFYEALLRGQMIDILAPDGTQCGSLNLGLESGQCRTEDVTLALDGTPIQLRPRDTVAGSCAYRWWPSALQDRRRRATAHTSSARG